MIELVRVCGACAATVVSGCNATTLLGATFELFASFFFHLTSPAILNKNTNAMLNTKNVHNPLRRRRRQYFHIYFCALIVTIMVNSMV